IWSLRGIGLVLTLLSSCGLASIHVTTAYQVLPMSSGGVIGALIQQAMVGHLNFTGASLILSALFLMGITLFTGLSWVKLVDTIGKFTLTGACKFQQQVKAWTKKSIKHAQEI